MFRKGTRQSRVSMERIRAAANSRLMRLAQKMIVGGALLLDRVANSHLHPAIHPLRKRIRASPLSDKLRLFLRLGRCLLRLGRWFLWLVRWLRWALFKDNLSFPGNIRVGDLLSKHQCPARHRTR